MSGDRQRHGDRRHEERRDPHGERESGHEPCGGRETAAPEPGPPEREPAGPDLLELDERALRALLRDAVQDVQPASDSLERLHRAVPARRARRRQLVVGAVAAALVVGVATPALMQSDVVARVLDSETTHAASSQQADEGAEAGGQGGHATDQEFGEEAGGGQGGNGHPESADSARKGDTAAPNPDDTLGPTSPSCLRSQLDGGATTQPVDTDGQVHGSFRITNISDSSCRVQGADTVTATVEGGADPTAVSVVDHTSGSRVRGLPDPGPVSDSIILEPGQSYVVRFAWVPRGIGGTDGCPAGPAPDPPPGKANGGTGTGGTDGGTGDTGDTTGEPTGGATTNPGGSGSAGGGEGGDTIDEPEEGPTPQLAYDAGGTGGGPASSAVVLRYVPAAGEPRIGKAEIPNACGGTVYRTGPLKAE